MIIIRPHAKPPGLILLALALAIGLAGCLKRDKPPVSSAYVLKSPSEGIGGLLEGARAGDVMLKNDRIRLVIQKPGRAIALNPYGGNIIDLDLVREEGVGHDRFGELGLFINGAFTMDATSVVVHDDGSGGGAAVVRAQGPCVVSHFLNVATGAKDMMGMDLPMDFHTPPPLKFQVDYILRPHSNIVEIETTIINIGTAEEPILPIWLMHVGVGRPFIPESGGYRDEQLAQVTSYVYETDYLAYAFLPVPAKEEAHFLFSMAGGVGIGHSFNLLDFATFPDSAPVKLKPGQSQMIKNLMIIDKDVNRVTAEIRRQLGTNQSPGVLKGSVSEEGSGRPLAGATVTATDPANRNRPLALTHTDSAGNFELNLPAGRVNLYASKVGRPFPGNSNQPVAVAATVLNGQEVVKALTLPATGKLKVTVKDGRGKAIPARITVLGIDPSPPHNLTESQYIDPLPPGVSRYIDTPDGLAEIDLEPGSYDILVNRGMEYSTVRKPVTVAANATTSVNAAIARVVDTTGYLSGDFHVHAARGPDTAMMNTTRIKNMAAEGVDVVIATDHAFITDYKPVIESLGLTSFVVSVPSQEITTFDYGHLNIFPLPLDPKHPANGAVDWGGMSIPDLFALGHSLDGPHVIQINHPRNIPTPADFQNLFNVVDLVFDNTGWHMGPKAIKPEDVRLSPNSLLFENRFTAMEVMTWINMQGLSDWFNFLNNGIMITATGNTDTHTTQVESMGWPRNFVFVGLDEVTAFNRDEFMNAINARRLTISFGPFVTLKAKAGTNTAREGEQLNANNQEVTFEVRVQSPTWITVDTVDIYENGLLKESVSVTPQEVASEVPGFTRHETLLSRKFRPVADAWYTAAARGSKILFPHVAYNCTPRSHLTLERIRQNDVDKATTPFAIANPIFVDKDGDNALTPNRIVIPQDYMNYRSENRLDPYKP